MRDAPPTGLGCRELNPCTIGGVSSRRFLLSNSRGLEVQVLEYGATVYSVSLRVNERRTIPLTRGLRAPEAYAVNPAYMGSVCGRYAGRIANAQFSFAQDPPPSGAAAKAAEMRDGKATAFGEERLVQLNANDGPHHLHGGVKGFDARLWAAEAFETASEVGVALRYTSAAGEEGYPGRLACEVRYSIDDSSTLLMEYSAKALDAATVVNLTNHCYWNLSDQSTALAHRLQINANRVLEFNTELLPSGARLAVADSPFDFRQPVLLRDAIAALQSNQTVGDKAAGFDHCFVHFKSVEGDRSEGDSSVRCGHRSPRTADLVQVAEVWAPDSGRGMRVYTDQPALVFYTGNFLDGAEAVGGHHRHEAFCLECQQFPDAPNQPSFPSVRIESGEVYRQKTAYQLLFPETADSVAARSVTP